MESINRFNKCPSMLASRITWHHSTRMQWTSIISNIKLASINTSAVNTIQCSLSSSHTWWMRQLCQWVNYLVKTSSLVNLISSQLLCPINLWCLLLSSTIHLLLICRDNKRNAKITEVLHICNSCLDYDDWYINTKPSVIIYRIYKYNK